MDLFIFKSNSDCFKNFLSQKQNIWTLCLFVCLFVCVFANANKNYFCTFSFLLFCYFVIFIFSFVIVFIWFIPLHTKQYKTIFLQVKFNKFNKFRSHVARTFREIPQRVSIHQIPTRQSRARWCSCRGGGLQHSVWQVLCAFDRHVAVVCQFSKSVSRGNRRVRSSVLQHFGVERKRAQHSSRGEKHKYLVADQRSYRRVAWRYSHEIDVGISFVNGDFNARNNWCEHCGRLGFVCSVTASAEWFFLNFFVGMFKLLD